jgi:glutamate-1-semialdehyde 2,1-aminomutase
LGKVIGGGLPVGAYGGRREILQLVAPLGPMYQAGTLSGNPLAMMGGIATLRVLRRAGVWEGVAAMAGQVNEVIAEAAKQAGVSITQTQVGTMICTFFQQGPVVDWATAAQSDTRAFATYFQAMLANGVYLPPSQYEAYFLSTEHGAAELEITARAAEVAMKAVGQMTNDE